MSFASDFHLQAAKTTVVLRQRRVEAISAAEQMALVAAERQTTFAPDEAIQFDALMESVKVIDGEIQRLIEHVTFYYARESQQNQSPYHPHHKCRHEGRDGSCWNDARKSGLCWKHDPAYVSPIRVARQTKPETVMVLVPPQKRNVGVAHRRWRDWQGSVADNIVPVVEIRPLRDDDTESQHLLVDDIERKARTMLTHAPWSRRTWKRSRRYEGFARP